MRLAKFIKGFIFLGGIAIMLQISSCKDDQIDLTDTPLKGVINGEEWEYKFGRRVFYSATSYRLVLHSTKELGEDPCVVASSSNPHIQMVLDFGQNSYTIPLPNTLEPVRFVMGDGSELWPNSGIVEILAQDDRYLVGYIQAVVDDDNTVEGTFRVELC